MTYPVVTCILVAAICAAMVSSPAWIPLVIIAGMLQFFMPGYIEAQAKPVAREDRIDLEDVG